MVYIDSRIFIWLYCGMGYEERNIEFFLWFDFFFLVKIHIESYTHDCVVLGNRLLLGLRGWSYHCINISEKRYAVYQRRDDLSHRMWLETYWYSWCPPVEVVVYRTVDRILFSRRQLLLLANSSVTLNIMLEFNVELFIHNLDFIEWKLWRQVLLFLVICTGLNGSELI